jgi:RNA polymerase sigma-70 factor (ECF subfamily)
MTGLALHLAGGTDLQASETSLDQRLLEAAARRDQGAFAQIVRRHYPVVYRIVWRMMHGHVDAQDVTQEAFLRLWNNPRQLREAHALRSWLVRVAANLVTDRHRAAPATDIMEAEEIADTADNAPQKMDKDRVSRRVDQAIAKLPDRQRLALTLVQFEHFSNIKAAEVMELSVDALESLLARARRALKLELDGEWQDMLSAIAGR